MGDYSKPWRVEKDIRCVITGEGEILGPFQNIQTAYLVAASPEMFQAIHAALVILGPDYARNFKELNPENSKDACILNLIHVLDAARGVGKK